MVQKGRISEWILVRQSSLLNGATKYAANDTI